MVDAILAQNGVSRQEYDLLAALIQCEAGGESYIGQVAVGNVVMNRVESSNHPNTISEVIYAAGQFSPVRNGSLSRTLSSGNISASCRQAALEAIAGSEPVGDKLYFRRVNGRSGQVIGNPGDWKSRILLGRNQNAGTRKQVILTGSRVLFGRRRMGIWPVASGLAMLYDGDKSWRYPARIL